MSQLEPPSDRVILKPHDAETETAFGLALPETAQGKSQYATVLAVGAGHEYPQGGIGEHVWVPLGEHITHRSDDLRTTVYESLHPGDVVVMPAFNGTEIDWPGEGTVISILASELLCVVA